MTFNRKKSFTTFSSLCLFSLSAGSGAAYAQGLDSHVHGEAELNIVVAGQQLQIEFVSPAMNLLGFERAPESSDEISLLDSVTEDLQTGEWLLGNAMTSCQLSTVAYTAPEFEDHDHEHDEDGHEHEHDEDEHEEETDSHADFRVQYLYDCPAAPAREYRLTAFNHFSGIEEITVQWIAEQQQGFAELTAGNPVLTLE